MTVLIGVDPGARDTGIIAIWDDGRVVGSTIHNEGPLLPLTKPYITAVGRELDAILDEAGNDYIMHVEGVNRPNWHVAKAAGGGSASNPTALLGTAQMLGCIMARYDCAVIPPGKNGSRPLGTYPAELVSDSERRKEGWEQRVGSGKLRHQRSAWDIANATPRDPLAPAPRATRGPRSAFADAMTPDLPGAAA